MAYQPHTYVTCGGDNLELSPGDEIWQVGIRGFNGTSGQKDQGDLEAFAEAIAVGEDGNSGLKRWFATPSYYHSSNAHLKWVKVANIGADGHYTGEPAIYEFGSPVAGGAGAPHPSFLSLSLGFTTGKSFGRARSGRIFPPNYGCLGVSGSYISSAQQADLIASAKEFLSAVKVDIGDPGYINPYVISRSGVSNPITGVRVGNVWDVQRRRKNAVPETYATSGL